MIPDDNINRAGQVVKMAFVDPWSEALPASATFSFFTKEGDP